MKTRLFLIFILIGFSSALFTNCSKSSSGSTTNTDPANAPDSANPVVAKGSRKIGFDIVNESAASNFVQNATDAKSLGAEYLILDVVWNSVEASGTNNCVAGTYVDPGGMFALFNSTLPNLNLKMTLNFSPSTTNLWAAPNIFAANDFIADPNLVATQNKIDTMICRYNNALDFVITHLPNVPIVGLQIGNEIDYLPQASNPNFWANYWRFLAGTSTHAKTLRTAANTSAIPVGVTTSIEAALGTKGSTIQGGLDVLNQTLMDYVAVTYYPFSGASGQSQVDAIQPNMAAIVTQAKTLPVRIQEFGCQSGTISGSSTSFQASCFSNFFAGWDKNPSKITHAHFLRMNDLAHSDAYNLAASYSTPAAPDAVFVDYLETLGVKSATGVYKSSFDTLKKAIQARGW